MRAYILLAFLFLSTGRVQAADYAVLIGVDNYKSPDITDLQYAGADVKAVGVAMRENLGFLPERVKVLTTDREETDQLYPTSSNVIRQLEFISNRIKPEDSFTFYFSGHGFQREAGHWLATAETDPFSDLTLRRTALSLADLNEALRGITAARKVLILDACRNDPEKGKGDSPNKLTQDFAKDLRAVMNGAASAQLSSTATLLACSEGQRAWEWDEKGHGVFTYYLLEALSGGAAGTDGTLNATDLGDYVQRRVREWSADNKPQRDWQVPDFRLTGSAKLVLWNVVKKGKAPSGSGVAPVRPPVETPIVPTLVIPSPTPRIPDPIILPPGKLDIKSEPAGARVLINGQEKGVTPITIEMDSGSFTQTSVPVKLDVRLANHRGARLPLNVLRGQTLPVEVKLEPVVADLAGATRVHPGDGAVMVCVPAGEFTMGSNAFADETPERRVYLDTFWIDKTEVTVAQYRKFCQATGRSMPAAPPWGWKNDLPMVNVTWHEATAYALWAGKLLPTEAEWEKAARGGDGRTYPWGSTYSAALVRGSVLRRGDAGSPLPAGAAGGGASPYGLLHMAGNVAEWCADWYLADYYQQAPLRQPAGPDFQKRRNVRGGAWLHEFAPYFRSSFRTARVPGYRGTELGFRCLTYAR